MSASHIQEAFLESLEMVSQVGRNRASGQTNWQDLQSEARFESLMPIQQLNSGQKKTRLPPTSLLIGELEIQGLFRFARLDLMKLDPTFTPFQRGGHLPHLAAQSH